MNIVIAQSQMYFSNFGGANKASRIIAKGLARLGNRCTVVAPVVDDQKRSRVLGSRITIPESASAIQDRYGDVRVTSFNSHVAHFDDGGVHVVGMLDKYAVVNYLKSLQGWKRPDMLLAPLHRDSTVFNFVASAFPDRVAGLVYDLFSLPFGPHSVPSADVACDLGSVGLVVTISEFAATYLRQWGGVDAHVVVLPLEESWPVGYEEHWNAQYVTVINPCAGKGIRVLLEVAEILKTVRFLAVPLWGTSVADIRSMKRIGNIEVGRPEEDMSKILRDTKVLLMPSLWPETLGLSCIEAASMGIPVVASRTGAISEALNGGGCLVEVSEVEHYDRDGRGGLHPRVPSQNIGSWTDAILRVLDDPTSYHSNAVLTYESAKRRLAAAGLSSLDELLRTAHLSAGPKPR